jgi:hypothetical protein
VGETSPKTSSSASADSPPLGAPVRLLAFVDESMRARANHEWAIAVYRQTSGWVHFSVSHMRATTQVGAENDFFMGIPLRPTVLPESLWLEVYGAASQATEDSRLRPRMGVAQGASARGDQGDQLVT